jgi:hypothetical protein
MAIAEVAKQPGKRLALFFDGTWDVPQNNTNVWRLYLMLAERDAGGIQQRSFYDEGVGTKRRDHLTGGMFGAGLGENVRLGYRWLMQHYDDGDEIYLFGFSRGAFTARGLAGLIARCGLLKPDAPMSFWDLFERYKKGDAVRPIYELIQLRDAGKTDFNFEERVLLKHAWYKRNLITLVGVWDTVGALGVPWGNIPGISSRSLRFYNTHLTTVVKNAFQALALDEHRHPYWAMLWTNFVPWPPAPGHVETFDNRTIEQRWFSGAHGNVGGGYIEDLMPQRPLAWIQGKAAACGLGFRSLVQLNDDDLHCKPVDSYAEFLFGAWQWVCPRYVRWVQSSPVRKPTGWVETVNERIDRSVFHRCQLDRTYRPLSLGEWARRKGYDLETVIASPAEIARLDEPITAPGIEGQIPAASGTAASGSPPAPQCG